MALAIVVPLGPRVGSSFILQEAAKAGFNALGSDLCYPPEGNKDGYYEIDPFDIPGLTTGLVKCWPQGLPFLLERPACIVTVQRRSLSNQVLSIREQARREAEHYAALGCAELSEAVLAADPMSIIREAWEAWDGYRKAGIPQLNLFTEQLDQDIEGCLSFLRTYSDG